MSQRDLASERTRELIFYPRPERVRVNKERNECDDEDENGDNA